MIENFKTLLIAIAFTFSLLITGCSSTDTESVNEQEMDSQETTSSVPSAPSAAEERLYREKAKESIEKEETEKLKKRKSSDDDMERLD